MLRRIGSVIRAVGAAIESRASLENPNTSIEEADDWFDGAWGATHSSATGVRVNRWRALGYSPIYRGVNLISRDVAKLPCLVYERDGKGKRRATEHPAFKLLRRKPNREQTAFNFKHTLIAHAVLDGNGMAFIDRDGAGRPVELILLRPGSCFAVREGGKLLYVVDVNGDWRKLLPENVFHVKGFSDDGLMGNSLIQIAKESIGLGIATRDYGSRFFNNDAKPGVALEHPGKLSDQAAKRLRESWNSMHAGVNNAHKAAILEEGMKVNAYSINANDAQLIETRQFEIREVANWIGVPPHKLGDTSRTAYNSLEQENQSYLDDALDPWLVAFEEEAYDKLLTEDEKQADTHTVEFLRQALLRADMATRGDFYAKATGGLPWMTGNEVRGRENLNPLDGFDTIRIPTNNFGPPKPAKEKQSKAARAVLADAARRMAKRLAVHARKANKRPDDLTAWLDEDMRREHLGTVAESLSPAAAVLRSIGCDVEPDAVAERLMVIADRCIRKASSGALANDETSEPLINSIVQSVLTDLIGD